MEYSQPYRVVTSVLDSLELSSRDSHEVAPTISCALIISGFLMIFTRAQMCNHHSATIDHGRPPHTQPEHPPKHPGSWADPRARSRHTRYVFLVGSQQRRKRSSERPDHSVDRPRRQRISTERGQGWISE